VYRRAGIYYGVLDWKTGKGKRKASWFSDAKAQVSAYAEAVKEMLSLDITEAMVVVAYQEIEDFDPFVPTEAIWRFQKCELTKSNIKRSFNRFVKRIAEYHQPPVPKPPKTKQFVKLLPPPNPFEKFRK
jgi:PD-(D/E)XK nuclease superfamily